MHDFSVQSRQHTQFINIDHEVRRIVADSGVQDGVVHVFVPHTTAAVTINENADPDVAADIIKVLEGSFPWKADYAHAEGNSAAHVKCSLVGASETVIIRNGQLALGTWQSLFFCEFDGPRNRNVWVQVLGN